ncbi:BTAD domain-containing putative transcriptional regulator [Streptomyces sp. NPDC096354]|uniref:AfsR/SARP family transcriptional regulator n=1 Tax=Streptomyces sp. NPDC096354 TaxID=3366088 RepID=UPI0037FA64BF
MARRIIGESLKFSVIGEFKVEHGNRQIPLGSLKQRLVLMALLSRRNRPVSVSELTQAIWPENLPSTAKQNLQVYISNLRSLFNKTGNLGRISYESEHYRITVRDDEVDAHQFDQAVLAGREALTMGDTAQAAESFRAALDLWSNPPAPPDDRLDGLLAEHARWLYEQYLRISESWAEAEIEEGNYAMTAEKITPLIQREPLREGLFSLYMKALAGSGRRAEALSAYGDMRKLLAKDLGISPSSALQRLYQELLSGQENERLDSERMVNFSPTLIPRDLRDFIGLEELIQLIELNVVKRGESILLWGVAGIGKTSLAVHVAHRVAAAFPDGRFFVQVRGADGRARSMLSILREIFAGMGRAAALPSDQDSAVAVWQRWLTQKKLLVVFDDLPPAHDIGPLLPIADGSVAILTSRRHLADLGPIGDVRVPEPSSEELLASVRSAVARKKHSVSRSALEKIAMAIPPSRLAARVFGMKLSMVPDGQLPDFLDSLDGKRLLLDDFEGSGLSLRRSLASHWQDLSDVEQQALATLSHLPSEKFDGHAAAVYLRTRGDAPAQALDLLAAGVIETTPSQAPPCYQIPWVLREYILEVANQP